MPHAAKEDTRLNETQGECAFPSGNITRRIFRRNSFHRQRIQRLPQQTSECSIPTVCGETTTLCLNSHRASMLHSPTQPLPRGLVGNGTNEPPKPLRRMNNNHTNTRSGVQLRSHASTHCNHGTKGSSKPHCNHDYPQEDRVIPKLHAGAMGV